MWINGGAQNLRTKATVSQNYSVIQARAVLMLEVHCVCKCYRGDFCFGLGLCSRVYQFKGLNLESFKFSVLEFPLSLKRFGAGQSWASRVLTSEPTPISNLDLQD